MSTKVFKYGAFPPEKDGAIRQQMKLGRDYYNKLVEAENARRKSVWGGEKPVWPHTPVETTDDDGQKKTTRCKCDECQRYYVQVIAAYKAMGFLDLKPLRADAAAGGLYWGTYLIVEESFNAAVKTTKCFDLVKYRSWREGGYMGAQIQKVRTADAVFRLRHREDPRTGRRLGTRYNCMIRVGTQDGKPKWSDPIDLVLHRPLCGRPTWLKACMKFRGGKEVWSLNVTCADIPARDDGSQSGVVAIDVGWRVLKDDRLRIAFATGNDGKEFEFLMSEKWRELSTRADRIRGARKIMLNTIQRRFSVLSKHKSSTGALQHVLQDKTLSKDIELVGWASWERHMSDYETGCRRRSEVKRWTDMCVWLRDLRRQYARVVIKNSVHKEMKDHKKAVDSGMMRHHRRNAHHAAPGEVIEEVCKIWDRKTEVAIIKAQFTTATCPQCGHVHKVGPEQYITCEQCGTQEDRDRISTRNLLTLYAGGEYNKPTARKDGARFAKRHKPQANIVTRKNEQ